jgi:hypothetical protein
LCFNKKKVHSSLSNLRLSKYISTFLQHNYDYKRVLVRISARTFITSFVVQNFNKTYPFLEKSPRHNYNLILLNNKFLFIQLVKSKQNLSLYTFKYFSFFRMYNFFHNTFTVVLTINLLLSSKYAMLKELLSLLSFNTDSTHNYTHLNVKNIKSTHRQVVKSTSLNFKKYNYNTLLYTHMFVLITVYFTWVNNFIISTVNTCLNKNLSFYMFINLFYFKTRNY